MIATFNPAEDAITVDSRRELQFMTPTFVGIGYHSLSSNRRTSVAPVTAYPVQFPPRGV